MQPLLLLDEGLRLFFPVAALHGALWPLLWTLVLSLDLPLSGVVPQGQWHAHEMVFGTCAAALAGFLTSAVPEWTDTDRPRGPALLLLVGGWLPGRIVGLLAADALVPLALAGDAAFLSLLLAHVAVPMARRRLWRHWSFAAWLVVLVAAEMAIRLAWMAGEFALAQRLLVASLLVLVILFALSLSRINVVVLNLALDPSGETTPYKPHPGRQNLAAGLTALYAAAQLAFPQSSAPAFLALAAGAAFMDRLAEWFVGRSVLASHVLALAGANAAAGTGLLLIGAGQLGASVSPAAGLHILGMGCLGLALLAVFAIAGLRHTGRILAMPWQARAAFLLVAMAALVRTAPETGLVAALHGLHYGLAALLWASAFGLWLQGFLPFMLAPALPDCPEPAATVNTLDKGAN
ncbi:hypothetical protein AVW15_04905 [Chelatococcus daeguensis]|nr:hypothetical protein AVW15_04905 [Chelatococcus daeguensis]